MSQKTMIRLPAEVRSAIRSNININGYTQCVTELIYNSLDADATSIAIRVDLIHHKIQVVDNGSGILLEDLKSVGNRYTTSKCKTLHDLEHNLNKFGYRGEALASIANMSKSLSITSRHYKKDETYKKSFYKGIVEDEVQLVKMRPSYGTTITINDFMYNLGVRQKRVDPVLDMEDIRQSVETISLIHFHISFSIRDDSDGRLVLKTHKSKSIREAFFFLLDERIGDTLQPIEVTNTVYKMDGYIAKGSHSNKALQYVYVNKRPIKNSDVQKAVNDLLMKQSFYFREQNYNRLSNLDTKMNKPWSDIKISSNPSKFPVFIANLSCPYSLYDTTYMPDKSLVKFKAWKAILQIINSFAKEFVNKELSNLKDKESENEGNKECFDGKKVEDIVKKVLCKNAADFGASQLQNAIKGIPAKRKIDAQEKPKGSKKPTKMSENMFIPTDAFKTPKKQSISLQSFRKNCTKFPIRKKTIVKKLKRKLNPQILTNCANSINNKFRETPLVMSQLTRVRNISVEQNNTQLKAKKLLREFGVNSNHLVKTYKKSSHNLKVTRVIGKNKSITKSHTSISHSSVFHLNHKDSDNCLRNKNDKNKPNDHIDKAVIKSKTNIRSKKTCNNHDEGYLESYKVIHSKNLDEFTFKIPKKMLGINCLKKQVRNFQNTHDMVRTVIKPKENYFSYDKSVVKYCNNAPATDWASKENISSDILLYRHKSICKLNQLRDSAVQTNISFKDLDMFMFDLQKQYLELENVKKKFHQREIEANYFDSANLNTLQKGPIDVNSQNLQNDHEFKTKNLNMNKTFVINELLECELDLTNKPLDSFQNDELFTKVDTRISSPKTFDIFEILDTASTSYQYFDLDISATNDFNSFYNPLRKCVREDLCKNQILIEETQSFSNKSDEIKIQTVVSEDDNFVQQLKDVSPDRIEDFSQEKYLETPKDNEINHVVFKNDSKQNDISKSKNPGKSSIGFNTVIENDHNKNEAIGSSDDDHLSFSLRQSFNEEINCISEDNLESVCTSKSLSIIKTPNSVYKGDFRNNIELTTVNDEAVKRNSSKISPIIVINFSEGSPNKMFQRELSNRAENDTECKTPYKEQNEWSINTDSFGKLFYINNRTGMSFYENPSYSRKIACPYRVYKRPNFVPKGMSPILKLGESTVNMHCNTNDTMMQSNNMNTRRSNLIKSKWGELYYKEALYDDFAMGLLENMDALEHGMQDGTENNLLGKKNYLNLDSMVLDKVLLRNAKVINQLDKKFIVTTIEDVKGDSKFLTLFDQHAVHERIRLEHLLNEYQQDSKWKSVSVKKPLTLGLQTSDIETLMKNKDSFEGLGLTFQMSKIEDSKIEITSIPSCFQHKELNEDESLLQLVDQLINDEIDVFKTTRRNTSLVPAAIMKVISSKACHGAIKFGTILSKDQCIEMLGSLAECNVPFQCAHGRPVMTILADLNNGNRKEIKKLNTKNLKLRKKN